MTARFAIRGSGRVYWTDVVGLSSPTVAEINAAVDISADVHRIRGFNVVHQTETTATLTDVFERQHLSRVTAGECAISWYEDRESDAARDRFVLGMTGTLIMCVRGAPVAGDPVETWPAQAGAPSTDWTTELEAGRFTVRFAITDLPNTTGKILP